MRCLLHAPVSSIVAELSLELHIDLYIVSVFQVRGVSIALVRRSDLLHLDAIHIEVLKIERSPDMIAAGKVIIGHHAHYDEVRQDVTGENIVKRNARETGRDGQVLAKQTRVQEPHVLFLYNCTMCHFGRLCQLLGMHKQLHSLDHHPLLCVIVVRCLNHKVVVRWLQSVGNVNSRWQQLVLLKKFEMWATDDFHHLASREQSGPCVKADIVVGVISRVQMTGSVVQPAFAMMSRVLHFVFVVQ